MNITQIAQAVGKGVYFGLNKTAYFIQNDGSVVDGDGRQHIPANDALKALYDGQANVYVLPIAGAEIGGVKGADKTEIDTVLVAIGTDGRMYVPTYPAVPILNSYCSPFQEIAATAPVLLVEGSYWATATALKVLTDGVWVANENYTVSATEPTEPTAGDYWYDSTNSKLMVYGEAFAEVTETYVYAATEPHVYAEDERYANSTDKKIYIVTEGAWVEETGKTGWFYYTSEKVYTWTEAGGMAAV